VGRWRLGLGDWWGDERKLVGDWVGIGGCVYGRESLEMVRHWAVCLQYLYPVEIYLRAIDHGISWFEIWFPRGRLPLYCSVTPCNELDKVQHSAT